MDACFRLSFGISPVCPHILQETVLASQNGCSTHCSMAKSRGDHTECDICRGGGVGVVTEKEFSSRMSHPGSLICDFWGENADESFGAARP